MISTIVICCQVYWYWVYLFELVRNVLKWMMFKYMKCIRIKLVVCLSPPPLRPQSNIAGGKFGLKSVTTHCTKLYCTELDLLHYSALHYCWLVLKCSLLYRGEHHSMLDYNVLHYGKKRLLFPLRKIIFPCLSNL